MTTDLCHGCSSITLDALRSHEGFRHFSLLGNMYSGECALCSLMAKDFDQETVKKRLEDLWHRREARLYVHRDEIRDLYVTVGCLPDDVEWLSSGGLASNREGSLVRSFPIFANHGMCISSSTQ